MTVIHVPVAVIVLAVKDLLVVYPQGRTQGYTGRIGTGIDNSDHDRTTGFQAFASDIVVKSCDIRASKRIVQLLMPSNISTSIVKS